MGNTTHRRTVSTRNKALGAVMATVVIGGATLVLTGTAQASAVGATYTRTSAWEGGYAGRYVVTNETGTARSDWTLEFDLPEGTRIGSLWNGEHTVDGSHVTVRPASWNTTLEPGTSVTVGFVTTVDGTAGDPLSCRVDGAACSADGGSEPEPTDTPTPTDSASPSPSESVPAEPADPTPTDPTSTSPAPGDTARYAPYVDTSLYPAYDLLDTAERTGVKDFNLAFVTAGAGCAPLWGGVTALEDDHVAAQIDALRAKGGDVRVSFGGAAGRELALGCASVDDLAAAYARVVDAYGLTKVDFDVEGAALPDTAANSRRARAVARLQQDHPGLDVSFTLPAMPEGLTPHGVELLADAKRQGVRVDAVNIMAMDYGPAYDGDMGEYAIQAATATQAQIKETLGLSDANAWNTVAVTPMIGVNDVAGEVFTVQDATELVEFARSRDLAWLSMWSATRDKQCPGGAKPYADATCSSIVQEPLAFTEAFAAYR
ncbi:MULTISPECIES: cellulose binding domain-containing protein [unclassified Streptomyces]|uniref:cellulose binding domain-containing protein n=1 Tax=unclassified Streptomyces TaxID=2593676 RepID=UPI001908D76C|nr:cellulose binding domain-containing protein [Streptomyces sp. HSG2]